MSLVKVVFVNAATQEMMFQVEMPVENLPQSFEVATMLQIRGEQWSVERAEPATAEEFVQSGQLILVVRQVVTVPAKDILYSLPTICDTIPGSVSGSTKRNKNVFEFHGDDWRSIELLSRAHHDVVVAQLAEVERIYREESVDNGRFVGFKHLYLRPDIVPLFTETILFDQLVSCFPSAEWFEGIAYEQEEGLIEGGFAFEIEGIIFFGDQADGKLKTLCVRPVGQEGGISTKVIELLEWFMLTHHLYLVDWCICAYLYEDVEQMIAIWLD